MLQPTRGKINYAVEQRLRMIDFILFHFSIFSRKHLVDYFGVSEACVTKDISLYHHIAPDNMIYDVKEKAYKVSDNFKRAYE